MGMTRAVMAAVILAAGATLCLAADEPAMLTQTELKGLVDAGQYKDALKAMIRILQLKGPAAAPYDRNAVLMMRAECQLQIHEIRSAMDTLELARKEAVAAGDDAHAAQAMALTLLIQKSPGLIYTPHTGALRTPIHILDRALRPAAYQALYGDELAPLALKVKAALKGTSLVPIADAAKLIPPVRATEFVVTGANKQTQAVADELSKKSLKLLGGAVDDLASKTQQISDSANQVITENVTVTDSSGRSYVQQQSRRRGLSTTDMQALKGVKNDCGKIAPAAGELAQALGADAAPYKKIAAKADLLKDKANTVLTDDYSNLVH